MSRRLAAALLVALLALSAPPALAAEIALNDDGTVEVDGRKSFRLLKSRRPKEYTVLSTRGLFLGRLQLLDTGEHQLVDPRGRVRGGGQGTTPIEMAETVVPHVASLTELAGQILDEALAADARPTPPPAAPAAAAPTIDAAALARGLTITDMGKVMRGNTWVFTLMKMSDGEYLVMDTTGQLIGRLANVEGGAWGIQDLNRRQFGTAARGDGRAAIVAVLPHVQAMAGGVPGARLGALAAEAPRQRSRGTITIGAKDAQGHRAILQRGAKIGVLKPFMGEDWWVHAGQDEAWVGTLDQDGGTWEVEARDDAVLGREPRGDDDDLAMALEKHLPEMLRRQHAAAPARAAATVRRARSIAAIRTEETARGWRFVIDGELAGTFERETSGGKRWIAKDHTGRRIGAIEPKDDPSQGWEIMDARLGRIGHVTANGQIDVYGRRKQRWSAGEPLYKVAQHAFFGPDAE